MLVRFAILASLFAGRQKHLTFRAKQSRSAPKPHPLAHQKATLWAFVVPIPFFRPPSSSFRPSRSPFFIPHLCPLGIPHPFSHVGVLWGPSP
jgi:hypothetical protein